MEMKYFRILFGETRHCMLQFSEIRDTKTKEYAASLYLKGITEHVNQRGTDHTLFLMPERIHLVVIGEADATARREIQRLLAHTGIDTLVYAIGSEKWTYAQLPKADRIVCLNPKVVGAIAGSCSYYTSVSVKKAANLFEMETAGWKFTVRYCGCGKTALFHGPAVDNGQNPFADCVMSVKNVCREKECMCQEEPDEYGCALGCTMHQDYDACRYRCPEMSMPYVIGTVLLPDEMNEQAWEYLKEGLEETLMGVRFFLVPGKEDASMLQKLLTLPGEKQALDCKRYFIGADSVLGDELIASVSRSSQYYVPTVLKEGQAICCAGFLKYKSVWD